VAPEDSRVDRPRITAVLETVLYFSDQERTEAFYSETLGLRLLDREPGRSLFYRVGAGVLLLFLPSATRPGGTLPSHGATGPVHVCFRVPAEDYDAWKDRIDERGLVVLREVDWPKWRSFYFHDPDRNLLEIADAYIWPD
jgi:catechol 2,3-dioxygenase-like lactoylglutathione lyase family enzyme